MAEELTIPTTANKVELYEALVPQIKALTQGEDDLVANLANISAALHQGMGFFWVGFYVVKDGMLVLGPFQGPIACTRIPKGKGVCGTAFAEKRVVRVEDVDKFPGHIACSSDSKSEIVLPALGQDGEVALVLDVDSDELDCFDEVDQRYLSQVMRLVEDMLG